ncbi:MAG: hypothetical protein JOZ78_11465 [Chroococcidiopsidaceae cyanobacterium CP_BM_ER_R8_30]|nr:hypothetical protein [Chroococcidiopsidaceae cyanobacterium CP_BM_ER_R8_30]
MSRLFRRVKQSISRNFNRAFRRTKRNINSEVEEIIIKTLANAEIEEIVIRAVERVIFSLVRRYWFAVVLLFLISLGAQSVFLSIAITTLLKK